MKINTLKRRYCEEVQLRIRPILAIFIDYILAIINYKTSDKYVWAEESKVAIISCDIKGYPDPVFSWVKNNDVIASRSSRLTIPRAKQNDSGSYECWGNNTHGYNAHLVHLKVASKKCFCYKRQHLYFLEM